MAIEDQMLALKEDVGKLKSSLSSNIQYLNRIDGKIDNLVEGQNKLEVIQERLTTLQENQQKTMEQIAERDNRHHYENKAKLEEISKKYNELDNRIDIIEGKINGIDEMERNRNEQAKEKIKGKWAFFAAAITAIVTGITAIIVALIK